MTEIKLYNTKTRTKEDFVPIDATNVRMYVCGPTVYDRAHIGNARSAVVFDMLFRLLRHVYGHYAVKYVRNFTDVDDKINAEAARTGRPIREITDETIKWYQDDMAALGALAPTDEPRATEYIDEMIAMIEKLDERGFVYESEGHVLFRVRKYKEYGQLSGRSVDDMMSGARVEIASYKDDPLDFVLWKPSTDDLPGWKGPLIDGKQVGRGRPGWHIECSAMIDKILIQPYAGGDPKKMAFDIHGGGLDLQFPHHENEIAQSCCANPDGGFANVWMHNEMLQVEGKKMSKSLGNFFTVHDLLEQGVPGEVMRFVLLSTHYRKPMDWTRKRVEEASTILEYWHRITSELQPSGLADIAPDLIKALSEDLNTDLAWKIVNAMHHSPQRLLDNARFLGFLNDESRKQWVQRNSQEGFSFGLIGEPSGDVLATLRDFRNVYMRLYAQAKKSNDFSEVDSLRNVAQRLDMKLKVTVNSLDINVDRVLREEDVIILRKAMEQCYE